MDGKTILKWQLNMKIEKLKKDIAVITQYNRRGNKSKKSLTI